MFINQIKLCPEKKKDIYPKGRCFCVFVLFFFYYTMQYCIKVIFIFFKLIFRSSQITLYKSKLNTDL